MNDLSAYEYEPRELTPELNEPTHLNEIECTLISVYSTLSPVAKHEVMKAVLHLALEKK